MTNPILLVVDDDLDITEYVREIGEMAGYDVMVSNTSQEFKKLYISRTPNCIVMDIVIPDMDGIELIDWLSSQKCKSSIVLISGYNTSFMNTALQLGKHKGCHIIGSLSKPFKPESLESLIQKNQTP